MSLTTKQPNPDPPDDIGGIIGKPTSPVGPYVMTVPLLLALALTFRKRLSSKLLCSMLLSATLTACSDFTAACPDARQAEEAGKAFAACIQSDNPWRCGTAATRIHCGKTK